MTSCLGEGREIVVTVTLNQPWPTSNQVGANQKVRLRRVALTRVEEIRLEAQGWTPRWVGMSREAGFVDPVSE